MACYKNMSPMKDPHDDLPVYQEHAHDVWEPMSFSVFDADGLGDVLGAPDLQSSVLRLDGGIKPGSDLGDSLRLPDLENFTFGAPLDIEKPGNDSTLSHSEIGLGDRLVSLDSDHDLWKTAGELGPKRNETRLLTWDAFNHPERPPLKPSPHYLSESGPAVFDAALHNAFASDAEKKHLVGVVVQTEVFLRSLVELGLGQSSIAFPYEKRSDTFSEAIEGARMSGYSGAVANSIIEEHIAMGNSILHLRRFTHDTLHSSRSLPEHVALASCVNSVFEAMECFITSSAQSIHTLTQIQASFERPFNLLRVLREMVDSALHGASAEHLRQLIFRKLVELQEEQDLLSAIVVAILARVTSPLLESLARRVGLEASYKPLFNDDDNDDDDKQEEKFFDATEDFTLEPQQTDRSDPVMSSSLIPLSDAKLITETASSLKFLQRAAPGEEISRPYLLVHERPKLSWAFTLEDADDIVRKAADYEASIRQALCEHRPEMDNASIVETNTRSTGTEALHPSPWDLLDNGLLHTHISSLDQSIPYETGLRTDSVTGAALDYFKNLSSQQARPRLPIESVFSMSLGPLLNVQHSFVSAAALRTLFHSNSLKTHLSIYREFHLHGSGAFTSRLATVLFSPELAPAERVKGVVRAGKGMGLRLGSGTRRDWPPASSEIRLALMGVLNDSWNDITSPAQRPKSRQRPSSSTTAAITDDSKDLPGGLSFAIRELSEPEIERVLDSDSIYALDFLRLSHSPPHALKILFTPKLFNKYDRVFKLLLRIHRVKFVLDLLFRNTVARTSTFENQLSDQTLSIVHLFISQARHFTVTVSTHFELNGISRPWRAFQVQINAIEKLISSDTNFTGNNTVPSISSLTSAHAATLNRITSSLFRRKRHAHVAGILDEILGDVLALAKLVRDGPCTDGSVRALFMGFRAHVKAFLDACNDLGMKSANKKGREGGGEEEDVGLESARMLVELLDWR